MNDVQVRLEQLEDRGWTQAAIADEVGVSWQGLRYWRTGDRYPGNAKAVLVVLDALFKRKRVPKQRRYVKGSRQRNVGGGS